MKLLLDANIAHDFRHHLAGHEVFTARYMGWENLANGALLAAMQSEDFDVLVTRDLNIEYQQNAESLPVAIVVLDAASNRLDDLLRCLPALTSLLGRSLAAGIYHARSE
jgi:hypothetical protein